MWTCIKREENKLKPDEIKFLRVTLRKSKRERIMNTYYRKHRTEMREINLDGLDCSKNGGA